MSTYYQAIDREAKERISSPAHFAIKAPGLYHPSNPFPNIICMKNVKGSFFEIVPEWDEDWENSEFKDITEEAFKEYLEEFPHAKGLYIISC